MMMDKEHKVNQDILIGNADAKIWAKEFLLAVEYNPKIISDEETLFAWFANAIMAGYDLGVKHTKAQVGG